MKRSVGLLSVSGFSTVVVLFFLPQMIRSFTHKNDAGFERRFPVKSFKAEFHPITFDSVFDYMIVPVNHKKVRSFIADKAVTIPLTNNKIWPSSTRTVLVEEPQVATPGKGRYWPPHAIRVFEKPVLAKLPETTTPSKTDTKTLSPSIFAGWGRLNGLRSETVTDLMQDKFGNIWICTSKGVTRYDGKSLSTFTTEHGLAHNDVRCVLQDRKGNIWFGTNGGGGSKYDGYSFTNISVADGLVSDNVVSGMVEDSLGNIWIASWEGISRYDGRSIINYTEREGLMNKTVESILIDRRGTLWLATQKGISTFDGTSFTKY